MKETRKEGTLEKNNSESPVNDREKQIIFAPTLQNGILKDANMHLTCSIQKCCIQCILR